LRVSEVFANLALFLIRLDLAKEVLLLRLSFKDDDSISSLDGIIVDFLDGLFHNLKLLLVQFFELVDVVIKVLLS
jgi:hypothetical protein